MLWRSCWDRRKLWGRIREMEENTAPPTLPPAGCGSPDSHMCCFWRAVERVERQTTCLPCRCPNTWPLPSFLLAEGGAFVVVFAMFLASG